MRCINYNRATVERETVAPANTAWISITDPDASYAISKLDELPNFKIRFWDCTHKITIGEYSVNPPSLKDAEEILTFILEHNGKDFIVNCAAGISRSTAVCSFLKDRLGYEWINGTEYNPHPNQVLLNHLNNLYDSYL